MSDSRPTETSLTCTLLTACPDCLRPSPDRRLSYPRAADRGAWEALPAAIRAQCVQGGESYLDYAWPTLPVVDMLAFRRDGDRRRYETPYLARRDAVAALALAECVEHRGRFVDSLVNGVWCICEESTWSLPAHLANPPGSNGLADVRVPMVDLFAAETASLLAWVIALLGTELQQVSNLLVPRMLAEIDARLLTPALKRDFHWMGLANPPRKLNNWTPWIVSNWLTCMLLLERDGARCQESLLKALGCLDRFLAIQPADGGCDEGPAYWARSAASLFDCLEMLHDASGGAIDAFDRPLIRELGRFIVRAQIAGHWFVNFADAPARLRPPAALVYGYGLRTDDADMRALGAWLQRSEGDGAAHLRTGGLGRALQALFRFPIPATQAAAQPLPRDVWLPVVQVMVARDEAGSSGGWFLAAKGGHNGESHNHNDVGAFVVYRDGEPLLVDAGVGVYSRQTFSEERYRIWTMVSEWHNLLPSFDGVGQSPGSAYAACEVGYEAGDGAATLALDIRGAYPATAGVLSWRRRLRLRRGAGVEIEDDFELARAVGEMALSLVTPCAITMQAGGVIALERRALPDGLRTAAGLVRIEAPGLRIDRGRVECDDPKLAQVWGSHLERAILRLVNPPRRGCLRVLIE